MTLERLVEEIRQRAEAELQQEKQRIEGERLKLESDLQHRVVQLREESDRTTQMDAARERAQKVASAKLAARKLSYEAKERQMAASLTAARRMLLEYTGSAEYPQLLKRMFAVAVDELGKPVKIQGRSEDAAVLKTVAGKSFDDTPVPVLGGLIAESSDGARRLNLTFDELLRLREDRVRDLLAA